jgi:hypothetical protein
MAAAVVGCRVVSSSAACMAISRSENQDTGSIQRGLPCHDLGLDPRFDRAHGAAQLLPALAATADDEPGAGRPASVVPVDTLNSTAWAV